MPKSALLAVVAAIGLSACSQGRAEVMPATARVDYLVIGPGDMLDAVAPLVELRERLGHVVEVISVEAIYDRRSDGAPDADAVRAEIAAVAATAPGLRYLLVLGDPASGRGATAAFARVATDGTPFLSDHPFALPDRRMSLAVGRIPARTPAELAAIVDKIVRYETGAVRGDWSRRIDVFGGPAEFGPEVDKILENAVAAILEAVPYDFDIRVVFAKAESPYAYAFDALTTKLGAELAAGALVAVYTGHGNRQALDSVTWRGAEYEIGDTVTLGDVSTPEGSPFFISLTCLTGAYGDPLGARSLAEEMIVNPFGPVAVFAASADSHPVPNVTLGQAFLAHLFVDRAHTIGDAVRAAKDDLVHHDGSMALWVGDVDAAVWDENLAMYNLFGDPATRLRYPAVATVSAPERAKAGTPVAIAVDVAELGAGRVTVTIERSRRSLPDGIVTVAELELLDHAAALAAMTANNVRANARVIERGDGALVDGRARVEVTAPAAAGRYAVKVLVEGGDQVAAGSAWIEVE